VSEDAGHEWITVTNRRWCLGCSAFQWRTAEDHDLQPWRRSAGACPRDTPYAERITGEKTAYRTAP